MVYQQISNCEYLLSGDIRVEIDWYIHERDRYEADTTPDVDNILKPLLDALCGPHGILIDDCQIQAVDCRWIDSYDGGQSVRICLRFFNDEWVAKERLCFIHFGKGLCFPINLGCSPRAVLFMVEHVNQMLTRRNALLNQGVGYYQAKYMMSTQRVFHRSRVGRFPVVELDDIRVQLEEEISHQSADVDSKN